MRLVNILERITPDDLHTAESTGDVTLRLHLDRYQFACAHIVGETVLDIACGVGYGTHFLATNGPISIRRLTGVDISQDAIAYAKQRYAHPKVDFIQHDARSLPATTLFDSIVSLETIEHIPHPEQFTTHLRSLLKPHGILVGSVPVTPSIDANPHHLTDFNERSFRCMFECLGFDELDSLLQRQPFSATKILTRQEKRMDHMRKSLVAYYLKHPSSLIKRLHATLKYGFENRYLTIAWRLKNTRSM